MYPTRKFQLIVSIEKIRERIMICKVYGFRTKIGKTINRIAITAKTISLLGFNLFMKVCILLIL